VHNNTKDEDTLTPPCLFPLPTPPSYNNNNNHRSSNPKLIPNPYGHPNNNPYYRLYSPYGYGSTPTPEPRPGERLSLHDHKSNDKNRQTKKNNEATMVFFHVPVLSIDEESMTYVAEIFLAQSWRDQRLRLGTGKIDEYYRILDVKWLNVNLTTLTVNY
jgi:hypothetical protein